MGISKSWIIVLCVLCLAVGWVGRGMVEINKRPELNNKAMAWGYEEKSQLWNRIRVDENGFVICKKE